MKQYYYRNRTDIMVSILDVANGNEVRQIEILNKAKITHAIFKEYVLFLIQYGLIEYVRNRETYKTTAKGMDFLCIYNKMKALILPHPSDLLSDTFIPTIIKRKFSKPYQKNVWWYSIIIVFLYLSQTLHTS
ncbi:MAG TPA: winged helix-turn-helix domain-containing protein [Nitrososphaeraceae archaeon]|jgi:predicted transcriptional regulator